MLPCASPIKVRCAFVNMLFQRYYEKYCTGGPAATLDIRQAVFREWMSKRLPLIDVIGLAEFPVDHGEWTDGIFDAFSVVVDEQAERHSDTVVVAYRRDKMELVRSSIARFANDSSSKRIVWCVFRPVGGSSEFSFVASHAPFTRNEEEAGIVVDQIFGAALGVRPLVCGDFNLDEAQYGVWLASRVAVNDLARVGQEVSGPTVATSRGPRTFDYVFAHRALMSDSEEGQQHETEGHAATLSIDPQDSAMLIQHSSQQGSAPISYFSDHAMLTWEIFLQNHDACE